jgi:hypothetical protein
MTVATKIEIGPYVVGEKPPPFEYTYVDASGTGINLTGYAAEFRVQRVDGPVVTGAAVITDAAAGEVTHTWVGTEFTTPGRYWAEFVVGNAVNRFNSLRLEFTVRSQIGPVSIL